MDKNELKMKIIKIVYEEYQATGKSLTYEEIAKRLNDENLK